MSRFTPSGAYQPGLDIRCSGAKVPDWVRPLAEGWPPNSVAWLVVMARRTGKTWLASGIAHARAPGSTQRVDLRNSPNTVRRAGLACLHGANTPPRIADGVLLIDEPALSWGQQGGNNPLALAAGLTKIREAGAIPVLFATPLEYDLLIGHLGPDAPRDVIYPPELSDDEIARMTARAPGWAPDTVAHIRDAAPSWLQTPFLLELILHAAEDHPHLRSDAHALARTALDEADSIHQYRQQLLDSGLTAEQRAELRIARWRSAGVAMPTATSAALLAKTRIDTDPVVADYLPEVLRIHHISDLHHGGILRAMVDAKDRGGAGRRLADLAGAGSPLDSYLSHVSNLALEGRAPHLVIATGDIVNRPDDEHGRQAVEWLGKLRSLLAAHRDLRPSDPRIVLVGGNHDVSWDMCLDMRREARHQWFADTFAGYPHPDLDLADPRERRLFVKYPGAGLRLALLGSAESGGEPAHDQDREQLEAYREQFTEADDAGVRELIHSFERLDPGIIARDALDRLLPEEGYLTVAALHHPVSPVPSVEVAPYTGILNAGQVKRALVSAGTALVLHGHTHLSFLAAERLLGLAPEWTIRIACAATLASAATDEQNGYNEVLIAREGGTHRILVRPVRLDGGQWLPRTGSAFRPGEPSECPIYELAGDPS